MRSLHCESCAGHSASRRARPAGAAAALALFSLSPGDLLERHPHLVASSRPGWAAGTLARRISRGPGTRIGGSGPGWALLVHECFRVSCVRRARPVWVSMAGRLAAGPFGCRMRRICATLTRGRSPQMGLFGVERGCLGVGVEVPGMI